MTKTIGQHVNKGINKVHEDKRGSDSDCFLGRGQMSPRDMADKWPL